MLQFTSYKESLVQHSTNGPETEITKISAPAAKKLRLTSITPHHVVSQESLGKLYGLGDNIEQMTLKVLNAKEDPCAFEVKLAISLTSTRLDELNAGLASGSLEVKFR